MSNNNYSNNNNNNNYNRRGRYGGDRDRDRGGGGGGGGRRYNNNRGGGQQQQDLPWEEGIVCSLKESFGFIYCADRPEEVFFHYSQLSRHDFTNPQTDLQLKLPVRFQIGPSKNDPDKMAAFNVRNCTQPIVWEVRDGVDNTNNKDAPSIRVQGLVEKPTSSLPGSLGGANAFGNNNSNNNNNDLPGVNHNTSMDGNIRVLMQETDTPSDKAAAAAATEKKEEEKGGGDDAGKKSPGTTNLTADGPLIRFTLEEYRSSPDGGGGGGGKPGRLFRGDLVEFEIVTDRRTKFQYARNIVLLQSEKERARLAAEKQLLEQATLEHGVITSLKGEYGFLKSNKRREEVFFHYSSIEMPTDEDGNEMVLQEGQDMQFLVVTEGGDDGPKSSGGGDAASAATDGDGPPPPPLPSGEGFGRQPRRISARKVKMQPRGSVQFHDSVAKCRTGVVLYPPQPHDSGHLLDQHGKVRLDEPVMVEDYETGETSKEITEIYLNIKDAPGGSFAFRGGTSVGMWVQAGDTLLFDVVRDFVDGSCHAGPTYSLTPKDEPPDMTQEKAVRLIDLALAMRAEGVINAVKDTYGFLHFAERPVDVHFKLFQVLPDPLQRDLRRNLLGYKDEDNPLRPLKLEVGTEVTFDLSVHGTIHNHHHHQQQQQQQDGHGRGGRRGKGGGGGGQQERENLKAQRILFLPPKSIVQSKVIGTGVEGVIVKQDVKQPYAGMVELATPLLQMSLPERHPVVARMLDQFMAPDQPEDVLIFHDVQSSKEDKILFQLAELKYPGCITWRHTTEEDKDEVMQPVGKLVLTRKKKEATEPATPVAATAEAATDGAAAVEPSKSAEAEADEAEAAPKTGEASAYENADAAATPAKKNNNNNNNKKQRGKQPKLDPTPVKSLRYDKGSLGPDLKKDVPPAVGDRVVIDIKQIRRTGVVNVSNMKMVERKMIESEISAEEAAAAGGSDASADFGMGVVTEVVAARKFGFISVLDETATKREALFFQFSSVQGNNNNKIRRGDEVRFSPSTEKNGKRVALNISILPRGTIPSKADKNACLGIVLLQPAHTELKSNSGSGGSKGLRHAASNASSASNGSRWETVDKEGIGGNKEQDQLMEQGCILLTSDPTGMFTPSTTAAAAVASTPSKSEPADASSGGEGAGSEATATAPSTVSPTELRQLHYKNGALAIHGSGSSSSTTGDDGSHPKRGDLVSFVKTKKQQDGSAGVRDVRIVQRGAATLIRGKLVQINVAANTAQFVVAAAAAAAPDAKSTNGDTAAPATTTTHDVSLSTQIVGCPLSVLKEGESVEAILYEDDKNNGNKSLHGICRTADLYLETKVQNSNNGNAGGVGGGNNKALGGGGGRERPKLNLTVKKDRGGTIMAQSSMAKGPDGSNGFAPGWTTRQSRLVGAS